jgi:hypothetical protein
VTWREDFRRDLEEFRRSCDAFIEAISLPLLPALRWLNKLARRLGIK